MTTKDRLQIIRHIKAKARLAGQLTARDPEPQTPDLLQTVGIRDISFLVADRP